MTEITKLKFEDFYELTFAKKIKLQAQIEGGQIHYDEDDFLMKYPRHLVLLKDLRDRKTGELIKPMQQLTVNKNFRKKLLSPLDYIEFYSVVKSYKKRSECPDPTSLYASWADQLTFINRIQGVHLISDLDAQRIIKINKTTKD